MKSAPKRWLRTLLWQDWPHRLTVLLSGLFLLQFAIWFSKEDGLWLPETFVIVELTLLVTMILEHLPRMHWLLRGSLQLIAIVAIHVLVLRSYGVIEPMPLSSFFSSRLFLNLYELTPYLWFGLGTWVVYLTIIWWVEVKWRVYVLMIASVLVLSVRDSFSSIFLWPQVAMMVGCGLFLLILSHFQQLRRRDLSAWNYLAEYPISIAFPVIALVSLTVFVGAVMPEVGPLVTDPYTAWRTYRGEPMSFTTGKGVQVSQADPRDSSSGYSRSDSNLGGGFQFDYTPVMSVDTTHRSYWRGETRSLYTGKGWDESDSEKRGAWNPVKPDNGLPPDPRLAGSKLKTIEVTQKVTLQTEERFPVLFGAYALQRVTDLNGEKASFDPLQWSAQQGELRFSERQPYPKTYTVVSQMPIIDEEAMRSASPEPTGREWQEYLQLPDNLPARVKQLAADITKDAANPYDKAKKIEQYLQTNFSYTNKPDLTKGRSRDFVDRFLFEMKEGYCDYYSTAMAVMARSIGLPSRWVKGYASGSTALDQELMGFGADQGLIDPDAAGVYTVRNSDAHSWVEIYFTGYGWVPFEPTAGFTLPRAVQAPEPSEAVQPVTPAAPESAPDAAPAVQPHYVWYSLIAAAVLALLGLLGWKLQVIELVQERARRRRASLLKQKVIVECERMLRIFRRNGYVREEHETLREAIRRWTKQSKWMKADLDLILQVFEKAKYGRSDITEEDLRHTAQSVEKLRSQL
ncbi:DUF4129 domain-containing protein [Paenibacillus filicis]|uniref:DUF4129 domain-containing protein n=1 Tax=Paenibacillus gyeongsangnamensis TaxID=3388067 RepID=A0ABT4Q2K1_9BACL|nr:transglutaminase domain-containing protein [Paenibacillus filicis]MCZ8511115.1 DUF4129 domain-containing protein [Paenibacillus filicis]